MQNRITPEMVVEAYEKTGLRAAQHSFYSSNGCACGIGAVYAATGVDTDELWSLPAREYAEKEYGVEYTTGFIDGFDGTFEFAELREFGRPVGKRKYKLGLKDGEAAWKAAEEKGVDGE